MQIKNLKHFHENGQIRLQLARVGIHNWAIKLNNQYK